MTLYPSPISLALSPVHFISCRHRMFIFLLCITSTISLAFPVRLPTFQVAILISLCLKLVLSVTDLSPQPRSLSWVRGPCCPGRRPSRYGVCEFGSIWFMIGAKFSDRMPFLTSTLFFGWDPSLWCRHRPARQRGLQNNIIMYMYFQKVPIRETLPSWLEKREKRKERSALLQPLAMQKIYCQTHCTSSRNMLQKVLTHNQKMAFGEQLKYSQTKMEKLRRVYMFNAMFHVKAWLSTTSAADAPLNDLQLWHDLNMYTKTDSGVAGAVITALDGHLWYLAEEIVPFALFSNLVSESEKRQIARQLLKVRGTEPLKTRTPVFPQLNASTRLIHLIGKKSLLMFNLLNIESDWLGLPPAQWETVDNFQKAAMFVFHVKVVNDLSERAMKLITDFADTVTNYEDQLQFMLPVVEAHRRKLPGFTKETLKKI